MRFHDYLRCDGALAMAAGALLVALGLRQGRQPPADAVFGGAVMLGGTAGYLRLRQQVSPRRAGDWFTRLPLQTVHDGPGACPRPVLLGLTFGATVASAAAVVGLSLASGFWLTYMDAGVWAIAIGAIKVGPGSAAVARAERREGLTYEVARRSTRGRVELSRGGPLHTPETGGSR